MIDVYLEEVLGTKTKVNIISALIDDQNKGLNEGRLADRAGVSASEVNRQITDLVTVGLVTLNRVGRSKLYRINVEHFLYQPLCELFRTLSLVYRDIAEGVRDYAVSLGGVVAVVLVGSLASGRIREDYVSNPSDVDVVVVVEDDADIRNMRSALVWYTMNELFPKYGVNAYTILLTKSEYIDGLSDDRFILTVHTSGETLFGVKPTRTGRVVAAKSAGVS